MNTPHLLELYEGPLKTRGACFPGDRVVFHGLDLHKSELMHLDWIGLHVFGITGRLPTPAQQKVLNYIWTITSYPDARLWNNRVAALAGSTRSTGTLGISAAIAGSEAYNFGHQPMVHAASFLVRAKHALDASQSLDEIIKQEINIHKHLGGFGRPVATQLADERIPILLKYMEDAGIPPGIYFNLAFQIEQVLQNMGLKLTINYAGAMVAPMLDFGFSPRECYMFVISCFEAGMAPCYIEAINRPVGATFPMRCANIKYDGCNSRTWDTNESTAEDN